jgi:hypothetical protein
MDGTSCYSNPIFLNPEGEEIVDTVVKRLGELEFTEILEEVIEIRDME